MSVAFLSWAARTLLRASGWAEREGGARRRVRCCCFVVVVVVVGAVGISKSSEVSNVNEGAMAGNGGGWVLRVLDLDCGCGSRG